MNSIFLFAATVCALLLGSCAPAGKPPLPSPDGSLVLFTSAESSHADPKAYGCIIIDIRDKTGKSLYHENTLATDGESWGFDWMSNDKVRLTGSNVGSCTWTRNPDGTWSRR